MAKTVNTYTIMAKLEIDCDIDVKAESLEDALAKSKELKELDFIDFKGNLMDSNLHIHGLFEN